MTSSRVILFDEPRPLADAGRWPGVARQFEHVLGYSVLGHMFVGGNQDDMYAVVHPLNNGFRAYGPYESLAEFRREVLDDPGFLDYVIPQSLIDAVAAKAGALDAGQVYYPVPYPVLGGSGEPETYDRGDVWIFWSILDQIYAAEPDDGRGHSTSTGVKPTKRGSFFGRLGRRGRP